MSGLDEQYRGFPACPKCEEEYYWVVKKANREDVERICLNTEKYFSKNPGSMKINTGGTKVTLGDIDSITMIACAFCGHKPNSLLIHKVKVFAKKVLRDGEYVK